ncbi:ferrous iron transport protein B [Thiohalobacter sp. IOR34]|uniref:ferrous iron transport protein B n=1 Tax=Thiohalobacter sp. IOR34 TaxID=3057176 RepID=UPI0025B01EB2|nr:ferrous iron transport protein B [Thiohalobacter sp. IOR34]WJW76348.1 ferrous iron transport protein B [Thiohalobacter sp. IOR34]
MTSKPQLTVALAAIPNTGKTTLFNQLTGAHQTVGNWPGVTVTKRTGFFDLDGYRVELIDLPGAYSINPTSEEQRIVEQYLLQTPPDVILNILDARNLYRGLGLTLQLALSGLPMVVAVNMMDEARRQGVEIDVAALSEHLGVPVVPIVARTGEGLDVLKAVLLEIFEHPEQEHPTHISFPPVIEEQVMALASRIQALPDRPRLDETLVAVQLLKGGDACQVLGDTPGARQVIEEAACRRREIESATGESFTSTCAQCRFNAARGLALEATHSLPPVGDALSSRLDAVLLHPLFGLPLFFLIMFGLLQAIYAIGFPLQSAVDGLFQQLDAGLRTLAPIQALPGLLRSFLLDGLLAGVGVVVTFFPLLAVFFVLMSLIEGSGYISRAAFLMDRLMHLLGLDGKAFVNVLLGFGCNVPAVMGTRILSSRHNRIVTMLLIPFSLCSARLQVFVFLAAILFPPVTAGLVLFGLYVGSFLAVVLVGLLLKLLRVGGQPEPFIMELPPYRIPLARSVLLRAWHEIKAFLNRAATLILSGVVIVWFLTHVPTDVPPGSLETLAGRIGQISAPLFEPLGIHWQETVALIFGFLAKEIVLGSMAVIYGGQDLAQQLPLYMTPLRGLSFMVFTLLYTPCVATVATIHGESRSWRVTTLAVMQGLLLAWLAALLVYQGGRLLGFS